MRRSLIQIELEHYGVAELIIIQAGCKQAVPVRTTAAPPPPVPGTTITSTAPAIIMSFVTVTYQPPSSPFSISPGGPKGGEVERDVEEKGLEVRDS